MIEAEQVHTDIANMGRHARALLTLLDSETQAVLEGDVDRLDSLLRDKQGRSEALARFGDSVTAWLDGQDFDTWLAAQDEDIRDDWQALSTVLRECRRKNDANGLLIQRRQAEVEARLRPADSGTYGASGQNLPEAGGKLAYRA